MPRRKDLWRSAIVHAPAEELLTSGLDGGLGGAPVTWLPPQRSYAFLADPFGVWAGDAFHVFVEHYDYRTRHGTIERYTYDGRLRLVEGVPALAEPWHLSYPFVFEAEGAAWMLPEAHRSGTLTLYRAHGSWADWRPECRIELDCVPVDASILRHQGRWWLFYASASSRSSKLGELRVAWAHDLCGPWTVHPGNPVRQSASSSRPGGTPVVVDDMIVLPVQDCAQTYGGAVRPLWISRLEEEHFAAEQGERLAIPQGAPAGCEGMHTFSACGAVTLVDVKTVDRSLAGLRIELGRLLRPRAAR